MTVTIDPYAGFCWGVVRTIQIAEMELGEGGPLVSLGDIIHNPKEIDRMAALGMSTIAGSDLETLPPGTRVLIRAHGEPPATYRAAQAGGVTLVDATCPVVTKLQERIRRFYDDGYQVVIFGKKDHAEVIGLRGVCGDDCVVISSLDDARQGIDLGRNTVLFSQTTMDKPTFHAIRQYCEERIATLVVDSAEQTGAEFLAKDTICGQVAGREQKLREFARSNDLVIFIAGRNSSNGQVLCNICRDTNPRTQFIEDVEEIRPAWFHGIDTVGITGATSTPRWLMQRAADMIEHIS